MTIFLKLEEIEELDDQVEEEDLEMILKKDQPEDSIVVVIIEEIKIEVVKEANEVEE